MSTSKVPPGEASRVRARRTLVIAPHYDDDVLGCGGLIAQLRDSGGEVRVLYLTDSSADESAGEAEHKSDRRRQEAIRALAVFEVEDVHHLGLPDGALADHVVEAGEAISEALLDYRPDLVLSVSPLEVTADHQAAFAALYRVLAPLRGDHDLDRAVDDLRVLLYDINRMGYPDILVDVSAELERIADAIRQHASQLQLHNYLEAALGARRYRTLSLPPTVEAAEAFRELKLNDFVTHSLAGLIRHLGGVPELEVVRDGPSISVVVRTKDRPDLLHEALASLADQTYRSTEVVVVNDGGDQPQLPSQFPHEVLQVDLPSNQGRAAAANAGVEAASGTHIAFLDDDDLAEPEHLATLAGVVSASGVRVAYTDAAVGIYELDTESGWRLAERRLPYSRDFDSDYLLFDNYIPFNTLIFERSLFETAGPFDTDLPFFEDWDFLIRLAGLTPFHHLRQVTCEYRHFRGAGHHIFGERPSQRGDFLAMKARVIERHRDRHSPELLARIVDQLRADAVSQAELGAAHAREAETLRRSHTELAQAYHILNGERESLRAERDSLRATVSELGETIQGLHAGEKELRAVVEDQSGHLERTYAEIERLNALIKEIEGTRAWKLHRWLERLKGHTSE
jgi:LmbE family N-acetylglucosaminyl deacetylase